jgi:hypothetical protein
MNIGTLQDTPDGALSAGQAQVSLEELASKIRAEYAQVCKSFGNGILHALEAGRLLLEAKSAVPHGRWLAWLAQNCDLPPRTANRYMRLAKHPTPLLEADPSRVADLSLRAADALLTKHKSPKTNTDKAQDAVRSEQKSLDKKIEALRKGLEQQGDCVSFLWPTVATDEDIAGLVGTFVQLMTRAGCRVCLSNGALMFMRSKDCTVAPPEPPATDYTEVEVGAEEINLN